MKYRCFDCLEILIIDDFSTDVAGRPLTHHSDEIYERTLGENTGCPWLSRNDARKKKLYLDE